MKKKDFLILLIPSFIVVVAWIIFQIYHSSITSTIPASVTEQIIPITPNFDTQTIQKLGQRTNIDPLYQTTSTQPTPVPTIQIASPSATPSPTASGSGQTTNLGI